MAESKETPDATTERRSQDREPIGSGVAIRIETYQLVGTGQNLSADGVLFVADGTPRVKVLIEGEEPRIGELVRIQKLDEGRVGIAVRFCEPDPADA